MQHKFGIEKNIGLVEPYNSENKDLINLKKFQGFSLYYTFPVVKGSCYMISEVIVGMLHCPHFKAGTSRVQHKFKYKELKKLMKRVTLHFSVSTQGAGIV